MTSIKIAAAAAVLAVAAAAPASFADDGAGVRLGLGARASVNPYLPNTAFAAAIATRSVYLEVAANLATQRDNDGTHARDVELSVAALPVVARRGAVALEAGLRVGADWSRWTVPGNTGTGRVYTVAAPVRIDVDVTRWLSLEAEASITLLQSYRAETVTGPLITAGGQYVGGFTVWF
jgi:hypothetical protein